MSFLILWFFLFGRHHDIEPKCPPLHSEVKSVYSKDPAEFRAHSQVTMIGDYMVEYHSATTTYDLTTGQLLGVEIGTTTDTEAIAYNKRVHECQTLNGEFTAP